MWRVSLSVLIASLPLWLTSIGHALQINVTGLTGNELAAFNRAASQWESRIDDPITVDITAQFGAVGGAAQASFFLTGTGYSTVRNAMIADAAGDSSPNDSIVSFLPTNINFDAASGTLNNPNVFMTRPNARALGFSTATGDDGTITFSNSLSWDYDNSDGVSGFDFESVAAHEIGHILGFADNTGGDAAYAMDLFRFHRLNNNPATISEFTNFNRELREERDTAFDIVTTELRHSYTSGTDPGADGFSPAHWYNAGPGNEIGAMDPQIVNNTIVPVGDNDLLLLDVIGYGIVAVPEPSTVMLAVVGLLGAAIFCWRRRGRLKAETAER